MERPHDQDLQHRTGAELVPVYPGVSRRRFVGYVAASAALAGALDSDLVRRFANASATTTSAADALPPGASLQVSVFRRLDQLQLTFTFYNLALRTSGT